MHEIIPELYEKFLNSTGVCTDSRNVQEGNIFFALKGEKFNGNKFAADTLDKGAKLAIIDEKAYYHKEDCLLVNNALEALQQLANYHRQQLSIPLIAISGSNGKTTTKELMHKVLAQKYICFATPGNLNNHIGVPLSLLQISHSCEIAILEMGANHLEELNFLCGIAEPTHGLLTNIGMDHLEGYGSYEGVARGNSELYYYLLKNDGIAFVNSHDELLMRMSARLEKRYTYPQKGNYYHCYIPDDDDFIKVKTEDGLVINTQLIGNYNFYNIAAALCAGKFFHVPARHAKNAVETYKPDNNRSQVIDTGKNFVILDAYNANPSSMKASVESFLKLKAGNKWLILGDMSEMGNYSEQEHQKVTDFVENVPVSKIVFIGNEFYKQKRPAKKMWFFHNRQAFENYLQENPPANATILIKASRSMALEALKAYF